MKFEPEHDPDPLNRKFQEVEDINDLPEDTKARCGQYYESLLDNIKILRETTKSSGMSDHFERSDTEDAIIKYNALMQKQIIDLQQESRALWQALMDLGIIIQSLAKDIHDDS
jgi:hypothetical protein